MCTNLSLQLFSGFAGVIVGLVISYFSQRKLIAMQITAANQSNEKLLTRLGEQIDLQIRASELSAISTLLDSVNIQLGASGPSGPLPQEQGRTLQNARGLYHTRLHSILADMGRSL